MGRGDGFYRMPFVQWAICLATAGFIAGCGGPTTPQAASPNRRVDSTTKINIVCTTGMVADVVKAVGGDQVEVTQLMGEGVDPHTHKPSPGDVSKLNDADMIFYSGLHLESNLQKTFDSLGKKKPVFSFGEVFTRWHHNKILSVDESHDPHIWMDVDLWSKTAPLVADRLGDFDPKNAEKYAKNARAYMKTLKSLDEFCKQEIAMIPANQRVLVTAHDAFSYFAKAYGIKVKAPQGISTEANASTGAIDKLAKYLVDNKIKAVFVESSVNEKNMQQLIDNCKSQGHAIANGGVLYSDAMGKEGTEAGTYEGMIRHNVNTIVKALK